ncbi:MAG: DeoR/GlpR transcriptional regulator [Candidatus Hydrogenedentes bacterium]|nr:DeoR/GlpR transcriptional regulator [Candidatus Hydrogenedentota bacterium]
MSESTNNDRRELIRKWLAEEGSVRVGDLVERLKVTSMTVRRDLAAMEQEGVLVRTHGGAAYQAPMVRDLSFSEKDALHARQKAAIAEAAVRLLKPAASVFIDTGTTALHFARALPKTLDLRIFTNNLRVAMDLFSREGFEVNVYGGRLARQSPDLVGETALTRAQEFRIDIAFFGADAIDPRRGEVYAADLPTAHFDKTVHRQAERLVVLADSSKIGKHSIALVARLDERMVLVTDDGVSARDLASLRKTGADIRVVRTEEPLGSDTL